MIAYPDTSFLCALYVAQSTSAAAIAHYQQMKEPLHVSAFMQQVDTLRDDVARLELRIGRLLSAK